MQKVLLASTALVMTTGWAMADVTNAGDGVGASITLGGYGEMGVVGDDIDGNSSARLWTDVDIDFNMVGQTDGGLEFGVNIDLDESGDGSGSENGEEQSGEELWITGAFGRLTMGDTDGAFDWSMQETDIGHTLGDRQEEHRGFGNGNSGLDNFYDGQVARYEYAFGAFAVAASAELSDEEFDADPDPLEEDFESGGPVIGLGVKYSTAGMGADMAFGAGIQTVDDYAGTDSNATVYGVSADLGFGNGFRAILNYAQGEFDNGVEELDGEHYGVGLGYETGPWLIAANYGHFDEWVDGGNTGIGGLSRLDGEGVGVQANYDLGGGATLVAGIAHNDPEDLAGGDEDDEFMTYSFGVVMSF